jgi:phospholipid/cholesterol/gamma-HCH transport system substrate-binding protein
MAERVDSSAASGEVRVILTDVAAAARELRRSASQIADLSSRLEASQGRLDSFLANGDSVLTKINSGGGTIGLLVNDPAFYRNGDSLLVELRALVADLRANPRRYVNVRLF